MKGLFACIKKDIRLFFSFAGVASLLLPAVLSAALLLGLNDTRSASNILRPFPIAMIDEDNTVLSRSLIGQLRQIELFSEIRVYTKDDLPNGVRDENGLTNAVFDDAAFSGCAAIITLPYDYFYSLYYMNEVPVDVALNGKMELESALVATLISSVTDIIAGERTAWLAAYELYTGGEMDDATYEQFCEDASASMLDSALGRGSVFLRSSWLQSVGNDTAAAFLTCALCMLMLFVSAGVLKTLPDELRMGVMQRYLTCGGSPISVFASKYISSLFFTMLGSLPVLLILGGKVGIQMLLILFLSFNAAFLVMLLLCLVCKNTQQFMVFGGMTVAFSLLMGGTIYPLRLMPDFAGIVSYAAIPRYTLAGLTNADITAEAGSLVQSAANEAFMQSGVIPLIIYCGVLIVLCVLLAIRAFGRMGVRR